MKKIYILLALFTMFLVNHYCCQVNYDDCKSISIEALNKPNVEIIYEDPEAEYVLIELDGLIYSVKLTS
jgi:hypothetical protein